LRHSIGPLTAGEGQLKIGRVSGLWATPPGRGQDAAKGVSNRVEGAQDGKEERVVEHWKAQGGCYNPKAARRQDRRLGRQEQGA
jgi:hypothetical protein